MVKKVDGNIMNCRQFCYFASNGGARVAIGLLFDFDSSSNGKFSK